MNDIVSISLPYGAGSLTAEVPKANYRGTVKPPGEIIVAESEVGEVERALASPVGVPRIGTQAKAGDKVAIIVSDYTRPTPSGTILGPVLAELQAAGIAKTDVTIIVACGLHAPSSPASLRQMLGEGILNEYRVVNHLADDVANQVYVGTTSGGIPVKINRLVVEADFRIAIGGIDPHHLAGWSGGAKNLLPGVAARETINAHHILLRDARTRLGAADDNPFRLQLEEAARLAKLDFIVNVVLTPAKKIAYAVAGDVVAAHRAGVAFARERLLVPVPSKVDVVLTSPGGAPRDGELWQTHGKCLTRVGGIVSDGGTIIVAAECSKGVGDEEFADWLRLDAGAMEEALNGPFSMALAKAYHLAKEAERVDIFFVSAGLVGDDLPKLPVRFFSSLSAAIAAALAKNTDASVVSVPDAAGVLASLRP
jgi:nickel-dependent lactate racemase